MRPTPSEATALERAAREREARSVRRASLDARAEEPFSPAERAEECPVGIAEEVLTATHTRAPSDPR